MTKKPEPNDVDIVMLMDNDFDVSQLKGEAALLFDHTVAQSMFGSSVFWVRELAALGGEDDLVAGWHLQIKRDGVTRNRRGDCMISNDAELKATLDRIDTFRRQVTELRHKETNPENYRLAASSFLAEIDRMNLEVREYLSLHPAEFERTSPA